MPWIGAVIGLAGNKLLGGSGSSGSGASGQQNYVPGGSWGGGGQAQYPYGMASPQQIPGGQPAVGGAQPGGQPTDISGGRPTGGGYNDPSGMGWMSGQPAAQQQQPQQAVTQQTAGSSPLGQTQGQLAAQYPTPGLATADTGWQNAFNQQQQIAGQTQAGAQPGYQQSLQQQQAINYQPYTDAAAQAGQQNAQLANFSNQQGGQYGQQAGVAGQQQQNLYQAGNQIMNTAMDPQNALFNQQQQLVTDQTRAGQAARGLGNSAVGASEEQQNLSNFDINWQNNQLARQTQGMSAMSQGSNSGGQQGQLVGANMTGQAQSYGAMPNYTMQSGQVPMQAQQYAATQPGAAAGVYQGQMNNMQSQYGGVTQAALPYMNAGVGAQQQNYNNQATQNSQQAQMFSNIGTGVAQSYNTPGSWLSNMFGGSNNGNYNTGTTPPAGGGAPGSW